MWIENEFETAVLSVQYPDNYGFGICEIPEEFSRMEAAGQHGFYHGSWAAALENQKILSWINEQHR